MSHWPSEAGWLVDGVLLLLGTRAQAVLRLPRVHGLAVGDREPAQVAHLRPIRAEQCLPHPLNQSELTLAPSPGTSSRSLEPCLASFREIILVFITFILLTPAPAPAPASSEHSSSSASTSTSSCYLIWKFLKYWIHLIDLDIVEMDSKVFIIYIHSFRCTAVSVHCRIDISTGFPSFTESQLYFCELQFIIITFPYHDTFSSQNGNAFRNHSVRVRFVIKKYLPITWY